MKSNETMSCISRGLIEPVTFVYVALLNSTCNGQYEITTKTSTAYHDQDYFYYKY